jgi:hypothetical protein
LLAKSLCLAPIVIFDCLFSDNEIVEGCVAGICGVTFFMRLLTASHTEPFNWVTLLMEKTKIDEHRLLVETLKYALNLADTHGFFVASAQISGALDSLEGHQDDLHIASGE